MATRSSFAEKRRILQLETIYDLAVALHAHRPEQELVDELLQGVCAALDPAAAVAVTRDPYGAARAVASVGWTEVPPEPSALLEAPMWRELLASGQTLSQREGELAGREYREVLATPLASRGVYVGYLAVLDKEERGGEAAGYTADDRKFLESVAALAGVALDSARQVEDLETQRERLQEENKALKGRLADQVAGRRIVAHAPAMRSALEMVERVAPRKVSVVIRGESGTGKELVAKLVHLLSDRSGALVAVNCGALPETLLESELFGIEGGVATGVQARRGKFELADAGTLFLDEIGDMQAALQVKLLRALQEREIVRIGGHQPIPVDVRLVAATHRDQASRSLCHRYGSGARTSRIWCGFLPRTSAAKSRFRCPRSQRTHWPCCWRTTFRAMSASCRMSWRRRCRWPRGRWSPSCCAHFWVIRGRRPDRIR
jgi:transcriptional regulator with GAF, ATPase, and Fis domain